MITFDLETRSYADLPKVGMSAYAEDDSTEIICACWGIDDKPIQMWWPDELDHYAVDIKKDSLDDLFQAIADGHEVEAHNVGFEYSIWKYILTPKHGWPMPADHQWRDTMAVAAYYSLPLQLDRLATTLGFEGKDRAGGRLISKYSKLYLQTATKEFDIHKKQFDEFVLYCVQDVKVEQSVGDFLGDLPERELKYFLLDQKMNRRGLLLDLAGIEVATQIVDTRYEELQKRHIELTGLKHTQYTKCQVWFAEQGMELENMQSDYLQDLLDEGVPEGPVREVMELRTKIGKASTKKLEAMARQVNLDGRARYQTRYHGANTGRNTGAGFQPLNLSRGYDKVTPDQMVRDIMEGSPEWLDLVYGDAMEAVGAASRYWIQADHGHRLLCADYSSIEAIVLACLAGETWKVDAFRNGVKLYEFMGDKIYNLDPGTVTKETHPQERQDGKTAELAFGYQGALGAWLQFDNSGRHSDERIIEICKAWRDNHPNLVTFWRAMEDAAIAAVANPTQTFEVRNGVSFQTVEDWLTMVLPNDKRLWYWSPKVVLGDPPWHRPEHKEDCAHDTCGCTPINKLVYSSMKNGQWVRTYTYGGRLTENVCQATSREVLMHAAANLEDAGYPIILTIYDEILAEVPDDFGSIEEFTSIMTDLPDWCKDWPVKAEAWEGMRFRK